MGSQGVAVVVQRFGVYLVTLDPTVGSEISKTRPCVVISPDEMNRNIRTAIIAPMTTAQKQYPTRVACRFGGRSGEIVLDQIRTVDQSRLVKRLGAISSSTSGMVLRTLQQMFAP
jgi:mRNA interferase MazF